MTYYNTNVGATGANQPLSFNPQAVASSTGGATFSFPAVPNGQTWTGTVTVIGAPDSATMTISSIHLGNDIGQFIGGNNWGPLQLQSGDQLIVTATGLVAGTAYVCNFQGTGITGGDPGITYPEAYAHSVTTRTEQIYLASGQATGLTLPLSGATINAALPLNPAYRSIYVALWFPAGNVPSGVSTLSVLAFGNQSGIGYQVFNPEYLGDTGATGESIHSPKMFRIPLIAGLDTTLNLQIFLSGTGSASGIKVNWLYGADLATVDAAVYSANTSQNPGTNISTLYGGLPIENTYYLNSSGSWVIDPLQVALTNTVGTPFFVETVSGSTTAVTNTSAAPLYVTNTVGTVLEVQGIAGGTALPISGSVTTSGTVTNTPATVTPATSSSSGTTASSLIAVKASAGTVYGIYLFNNSTTANTYLQIWNLATGSITIGTTAPLYSFGVPYGGGAYIPFPEPLAFSTAITIAATTTRAGSTYATTGLDYDIIYV